MGLTKNLGWLSKYITADSNGNNIFTNNISIGGAAIGLNGVNMPNQTYLAWYLSGNTGSQNAAIRGNGNNLEFSSGGGISMQTDTHRHRE